MIARVLWLFGGLLCVGLGGLGAVVPGLPSTVFFIGAAACFTRSSERLERWVLDLPGVGALVRDHRAGLGMPRRAKWWAMGTIVAFSTLAIVLNRGSAVVAVVAVLAVVGIGVVGWWVPTRERVIAGDPRPRRP